jgi:hypothetical protein
MLTLPFPIESSTTRWSVAATQGQMRGGPGCKRIENASAGWANGRRGEAASGLSGAGQWTGRPVHPVFPRNGSFISSIGEHP